MHYLGTGHGLHGRNDGWNRRRGRLLDRRICLLHIGRMYHQYGYEKFTRTVHNGTSLV